MDAPGGARDLSAAVAASGGGAEDRGGGQGRTLTPRLGPSGRGAVVAHLLWEQGVPSSNLGAPTSQARITIPPFCSTDSWPRPSPPRDASRRVPGCRGRVSTTADPLGRRKGSN